MEKTLDLIKKYLLIALITITPLFFLNVTQEYFVTNKLYLLTFVVSVILFVTVLQSIVNKKIVWKKGPFDLPIFLFVGAVALSILVSSPDKIQALLNLNFGLVMMISLTGLYFYILRSNFSLSKIYYLSAIILSLTAIVFYFQPFKLVNLPQNIAFLKNPSFTPIGSQLDLAIYLGFFIVVAIVDLFKKSKKQMFDVMFLVLVVLGLAVTIASLVKPSTNLPAANLVLPPFRTSWFAALEVLKSPLTALFGVGADNYSAIFSKVKDFVYNQSALWQIGSFNVARSAILQIMTEAGLFGLASFGLIIFNFFKFAKKQLNNEKVQPFIFSFVYLLICLLVFPTSLIIWFLFFLNIAEVSKHHLSNGNQFEVEFEQAEAVFLIIILVALGLIGGAFYFTERAYSAEVYYKTSLNAYAGNNAQDLYNNQKQAIVLNPFMEKYRISFSQVNLLIANSIIVRAQNAQKTESGNTQLTLNSQDKQTVIQAVQAAISEAKAAVSLNPQKATNWENLATIYRNIVNLATGADTWTISAYQRAIQADPQNPSYRLNLGGVYYFLGRYDDAINFFTQTVALKPDFANAHYNLAWALFQKGEYTQAAASMQNVLTLINKKTDQADYDKAASDLANFKAKLPGDATKNNQSGNLNLPVKPPIPKISPKLELQREASPSAK